MVGIKTVHAIVQAEIIDPLLQAVKTKNADAADVWRNSTQQWSTVQILMDHVQGEPGSHM